MPDYPLPQKLHSALFTEHQKEHQREHEEIQNHSHSMELLILHSHWEKIKTSPHISFPGTNGLVRLKLDQKHISVTAPTKVNPVQTEAEVQAESPKVCSLFILIFVNQKTSGFLFLFFSY